MNALTPRSGSLVLAELRARVEEVISSARRYAGRGDDDPGFVLAPQPVAWHPGADRAARGLRTLREQPADEEMIRDWLEVVAGSVGNPTSAHAMAIRVTAISIACGKIPGCIWANALAEALQMFTFLPSAAEVFALLKRHDDRQLAEIAALDRIANGVHGLVGARESTVPYHPPAPQPAPRRSGPGMPCDDHLIRIPGVADASTRHAALASLAEVAAKRGGQPVARPAGTR